MRTVVFVERQELDFSGSLSPNALVLGDVDNDSAYELVVGSLEGDLLVFKGEETNPIATASGLGMVTCIGIGDICGQGKNSVFTVSAEGYFHAFNVESCKLPEEEAPKDPPATDDNHAEPKTAMKEPTHKLEVMHKQNLPANARVILLADIDLDGAPEFVVGYTDRKVRAFRWQTFVMEKDGESSTYEKMVLLQTWVLPGQVGSLSLSKNSDNFPKLVVSQPGCNYAELSCDWVIRSKFKDVINSSSSSVIHHPITYKRARNANISTEIVANVSRGDEVSGQNDSDRFAMCTLDGTLMLIEDDQIRWSLLVDHQLFSITKLDIMCDGHDEVVSCALDGETYIVDHNRQSVRFHFEESVCSFAAGLYSIDGVTNPPCLVYATFNNKIYIYWNVRLPRISSLTLLDVLKSDERFQKKLEEEGIKDTNQEGLRQIIQHYMYELPRVNRRDRSTVKKDDDDDDDEVIDEVVDQETDQSVSRAGNSVADDIAEQLETTELKDADET